MRELTILFMPESAYGPTNNCIGIGDLLRQRGHWKPTASMAHITPSMIPAPHGGTLLSRRWRSARICSTGSLW